jgi:hypothetical protein
MTELDLLDRTTRNRFLRRIGISLLGGAFAFGLTELTGQPASLSLVISIVFGGITLVGQLLMQLENRLAKVETSSAEHTARVEEAVRAGFRKMNDATELFGLVEASPLRTDAVTQLVRHSALLDPSVPSLVLKFAQAEIVRTSGFLKDLGEGDYVIYDGEDRDWLLALARSAEHSIDATSLTTVDGDGGFSMDGGLWFNDFGHRYLEVQREAVQRGVRIRRVFIIVRAAGSTVDPDLLSAYRPQHEIGIEARVLDSAHTPSSRRDALLDFVLFDRVLSYETTPAAQANSPGRPTIVSTRSDWNEPRVRARARLFTDLWESAREVPPPGSRPGSHSINV